MANKEYKEMSQEEHKKTVSAIYKYLISKLKQEAVNRILDRIAKKLGVSAFVNLISGKFPIAALAKFAVGYLKLMQFESFFTLNQNYGLNPYDPTKDEDEYVEYLLYSWMRGKPGYIYQFHQLGNKL